MSKKAPTITANLRAKKFVSTKLPDLFVMFMVIGFLGFMDGLIAASRPAAASKYHREWPYRASMLA